MNLIKISGKIVEKEKCKDNCLNILLGIPLNMKVFEDGEYKGMYSYATFSLFGLDEVQYTNLRKGNFVEIVGTIKGNCDKDGNKTGDIVIIPKTITKGVLK